MLPLNFSSVRMTVNETKKVYTINDLPDEVLEFILGLIPPYKDIHDCMLVSKRWRSCVLSEYSPLLSIIRLVIYGIYNGIPFVHNMLLTF